MNRIQAYYADDTDKALAMAASELGLSQAESEAAQSDHPSMMGIRARMKIAQLVGDQELISCCERMLAGVEVMRLCITTTKNGHRINREDAPDEVIDDLLVAKITKRRSGTVLLDDDVYEWAIRTTAD
jgi:hypothetical protein